jgi:hypothetical protein
VNGEYPDSILFALAFLVGMSFFGLIYTVWRVVGDRIKQLVRDYTGIPWY